MVNGKYKMLSKDTLFIRKLFTALFNDYAGSLAHLSDNLNLSD